MSQTVVQDVAANLVVYLTDATNTPVTGLTFSVVTCTYRKEGAGVFTAKVLTGVNFVEIGSGVYTVGFTSGELDTPGSFTFIVDGASISQIVTIANISATDLGASTPIAIDTCVVFGHIINLSGIAISNSSVFAKVLALPSILASASISSDTVSAKTDSNGEFFISLIRGAEVEFSISETGYKRTFLVPNQASANLFTDIG